MSNNFGEISVCVHVWTYIRTTIISVGFDVLEGKFNCATSFLDYEYFSL